MSRSMDKDTYLVAPVAQPPSEQTEDSPVSAYTFFTSNLFWLMSLFGGITNGICISNIAGIIDDSYFQAQIPMSSTTLAFMVSTMQIGALIGSLLLGSQLADKWGRRPAMLVAMGLFAIGSIVTASLASVYVLFTSLFSLSLSHTHSLSFFLFLFLSFSQCIATGCVVCIHNMITDIRWCWGGSSVDWGWGSAVRLCRYTLVSSLQ